MVVDPKAATDEDDRTLTDKILDVVEVAVTSLLIVLLFGNATGDKD
jgi:hypothetical protein